MAHLIRRTVSTSWDPTSVFSYLLDFHNAEEWDFGTVRCTLKTGDGGLGTTYENVSEFRGNETTLEYVVESLDAPRQFVITGRNKTVTSKDTVTVTPTPDGGSSVEYQAEMTFHGLAALASPFLGGPLQKLGDDTAAQLGRVLGQQAAQA